MIQVEFRNITIAYCGTVGIVESSSTAWLGSGRCSRLHTLAATGAGHMVDSFANALKIYLWLQTNEEGVWGGAMPLPRKNVVNV